MKIANFVLFVALFVALLVASVSPSYAYINGYGQSQLNSTTVPLGAGETFTGAWELTPQPWVLVNCKTDAAGILYFEFTNNILNTESTYPPVGYELESGINEFHTAVKGARYFRVRLVNGSDSQTTLSLHTEYGSFDQGILPINAVIGSDADTRVFRSVNSELDLALGRFSWIESGTKFGRNPDIDTGASEDLWNGGSTYTGQPLAYTPETVDVFSSNTEDNPAGTGAGTLRIFGLKTELSTAYEYEDIVLNGTTSVASVNSWWRINRAFVIDGNENEGEITVRPTSSASNVFVVMPVSFSQSAIGAYTVPAGKKILIKRIRVSITRSTGSSGSATVSLRVREPSGVYRAARVFDLQTGDAVSYTEFAGELFSAGSDIKFRIESVSVNNTIAAAAFEYILIDE